MLTASLCFPSVAACLRAGQELGEAPNEPVHQTFVERIFCDLSKSGAVSIAHTSWLKYGPGARRVIWRYGRVASRPFRTRVLDPVWRSIRC